MTMRAPVLMLAWEIWRRNAKYAWLSLGTIPCYLLFYLAVHSRIQGPGALGALSFLWMLFSLFWVMALFNYTENNPGKGWPAFRTGFLCCPFPRWCWCPVRCFWRWPRWRWFTWSG